MQHVAFEIPTRADSRIDSLALEEVIAAINVILESCVYNEKTLLQLRGKLRESRLVLHAYGCDISTPKEVALHALNGNGDWARAKEAIQQRRAAE